MEPNVTPEPILELVTGCMAAQYVMVGTELGLFEQLGKDAHTAEDLAQRTGLPQRSVRILANGLVALGLLEKADGRYHNAPEAYAFLSGCTPADLRPYVRMAHQIGYPGWSRFEDAIRAGGGIEPNVFEVGGDAQRILSSGIEAMTEPTAAMLAEACDLAGYQRILDVAGGTGIHLQVLLERHPEAHGILFELPPVAEQARQRLEPLIDGGRAEIVAGDVFEDPLPSGQDLVLLSNAMHCFTPDQNRSLLQRLRRASDVGTRLLLVDFWTNADHTEPALAALSAGEFYRLLGGDVYSVDEARDWLSGSGWEFQGDRPLNGPASLIEAEAGS